MDPQLAAKLSNRKDASETSESDHIDKFVQTKEINTDQPTDELSNKLNRRINTIENQPTGEGDNALSKQFKVFNPYTEFKEFSRKEIKNLESSFKKYDQDKDSFLGFEDLKYMMEKLGVPQTHIGLKQMIREIDEDHDGKISFREFLLLFRKAKAGEFGHENPLMNLYSKYMELESVDVEEIGVKGAKSFFESKVAKIARDQEMTNEILKEQEEKKAAEEDKKRRKEEFKAKQKSFQY